MEAMPFPWALWCCRSILTTGAVLFAGTAVLRLLTTGTELADTQHWRNLVWFAWAAVVIGSLGQLAFTTAEMCGQPVYAACCSNALRDCVCRTRFGLVWQARMGILLLWPVVAWLTSLSRCVRTHYRADIWSALIAAGMLTTLLVAGHAGASDERAWLLPANISHVLATGVWPGGLVPLFLLLRKGSQDDVPGSATLLVVKRYSNLSIVAVAVLLFGGVLNGIGIVGTWDGLWTTPYGHLVLWKIGLFFLLVITGAANRRILWHSPMPESSNALRRIQRNVAIECALLVMVLLITEALSISAPPVFASLAASMR